MSGNIKALHQLSIAGLAVLWGFACSSERVPAAPPGFSEPASYAVLDEVGLFCGGDPLDSPVGAERCAELTDTDKLCYGGTINAAYADVQSGRYRQHGIGKLFSLEGPPEFGRSPTTDRIALPDQPFPSLQVHLSVMHTYVHRCRADRQPPPTPSQHFKDCIVGDPPAFHSAPAGFTVTPWVRFRWAIQVDSAWAPHLHRADVYSRGSLAAKSFDDWFDNLDAPDGLSLRTVTHTSSGRTFVHARFYGGDNPRSWLIDPRSGALVAYVGDATTSWCTAAR
jgi:hypothetical protein